MKKLLAILLTFVLCLNVGVVFAEEKEEVTHVEKIINKVGEEDELHRTMTHVLEEPFEIWQVAMFGKEIITLPVKRADVKAVYLVNGRSMVEIEYNITTEGVQVVGQLGIYIVQFQKPKILTLKPLKPKKQKVQWEIKLLDPEKEQETPKPTVVTKTITNPQKDQVPNTGAYKG